MKKLYTLRLSSLLLSMAAFLQVNAQAVFQRTYSFQGFEDASVTLQTQDGGYLIGANTGTSQFGGFREHLIKTDASGNISWAKTYGGSLAESIAGIIPVSDGNYAIIGTTFSFNANPYGNVYLLKVDPSGTLLWSKMYGGSGYDYGYSVRETSDGGFIIAGLTSTGSAGGYDMYALRTDSAGNATWAIAIGGPSNDEAQRVVENPDGSFLLFGSSSSYSPNMIPYYEFATCKISANGSFVWMKKNGVGGYNLCYDVVAAPGGGYVMTGWTDGFGQGSNDVLVLKTDTAGNALWAHTYGGDSLDIGRSITATTDGGYLVSGMTKSYGAGSYDAYVLRLDSTGNLVWSSVYGGPASDQAFGISNTMDGGFVVTGVTSSYGSGNTDSYVIKCDASGNSGCYQDDAQTVQMNPTPTTTSVSPTVGGLWATIPVSTNTSSGGLSTLLCTTSGLAENNPADQFLLSPNPAQDLIRIDGAGKNICSVELYNATGQHLRTIAAANANVCDISIADLAPGIYLARVTGESKVYTTRFVRN